MIRKLVASDDPILTAKITGRGTTNKQLIADLFDTMYFNGGIGLAAPQIGVASRTAVIEIDGLPLVMVDPVIIWSSPENSEATEGCLSLPNITCIVTRPNKVQIEAYDAKAQYYIVTLRDLAARAAQHEIDHLNGILINQKREII